MIIGYTLSGQSSNDADFFDGSELGVVLCPDCGTCLDYSYAPASVDIKPSKKYDVSYTNDLRKLFSERFVEFCRDVLRSDDVFKPVRSSGTVYYYMVPSRTLPFDRVRRKTRIEGVCGQCGGYASVVGAHPAFLMQREPIGPGFFRTDLAFGNAKSKFPLIVIGSEWKALLSAQKFRGIDFGEIVS